MGHLFSRRGSFATGVEQVTQYASEWHEPVMVAEVLEYLQVGPGKTYIDGTLGGGGHSHAILDASAPDGRVIAIDRDPGAIEFARERLAQFGERIEFRKGNYAEARRLGGDDVPVDGFLVDAGVSSQQFDDPERGFSFRKPGPLDMRMGDDAPTLAEYLDTVEQDELTRVLRKWGEVRKAHRVARDILKGWNAGEVETTTDLADLVERSVPRGAGSGRRTKIHPATLVFQALRIAINRELEALETAVESIPDVVKSGGRAVFISFHSLEDRIVKQGFRELSTDDTPPGVPIRESEKTTRAKLVTSKPITASEEEIEHNPRARSAKLRVIEVL